jgi:hypothetical protein
VSEPEVTTDDLGISIRALNGKPADGAYILVRLIRGDKDVTPEQATKGLKALIDETYRLKDAWAHVMVDKDRAVRAASERALDCTEPGEVIADLEKQAHHFAQQYRATDRARIALVSGVFDLAEFLTAMQVRVKLGEPIPTAAELVDTLDKVVTKIKGRAS